MNSEDVVVDSEHVKSVLFRGSLRLDRNLSVVDSGEVTGTRWLVLFWLKRKGVRVDTWHWGAGVVIVWLHLVKVLTTLFLESVLTIEDQLEGVEWTSQFFGEFRGGTQFHEWRTNLAWCARDVRRQGESSKVGRQSDWIAGSKVPQVGAVGISTPDQFLDWVIVRQSNLLLGTNSDGIRTSVLDLFDQVFVTLLRESSALFSVEVHVVTPHLQASHVRVKLRGQVNVDSDFVVLQSNQWQGQSWVAVEEEDEWQVNLVGSIMDWVSRHLSVSELVPFGQVQFRVQSPPSLVVLIDSLTTDGQFRSRDNTLGDPVSIWATTRDVRESCCCRFEVHVTDQITVSGDSDGDATRGRGGTVHSLFDGFHRKVSVAFVNRLEKSDFWVTSQVDILGAIGDELHETTGHFVCFCTISRDFFFGRFREKTQFDFS